MINFKKLWIKDIGYNKNGGTLIREWQIGKWWWEWQQREKLRNKTERFEDKEGGKRRLKVFNYLEIRMFSIYGSFEAANYSRSHLLPELQLTAEVPTQKSKKMCLHIDKNNRKS